MSNEKIIENKIARVNSPKSPRDKKLDELATKSAKWEKIQTKVNILATIPATVFGALMGVRQYGINYSNAVTQKADMLNNFYHYSGVVPENFWKTLDSLGISSKVDVNSPTIMQDLKDLYAELSQMPKSELTQGEKIFVNIFPDPIQTFNSQTIVPNNVATPSVNSLDVNTLQTFNDQTIVPQLIDLPNSGLGSYLDAYKSAVESIVIPTDTFYSAVGTGVISGIVAFAVIAGFPIAQCAILKHKINKITKETQQKNSQEELKL